MLWYAVQVRCGQEDTIVRFSDVLIGKDALQECFLPRFEQKKKYHGEWHIDKKLLFPGYVFMISQMPEQLYQEVRKIPALAKILRDDDYLIPLNEEEIDFLKKYGKDEHVLEMSYGYLEGDEVVITIGPLKDFNGNIQKIDRHKRTAVIQVEFFGRSTEIKVGLEVVRKG